MVPRMSPRAISSKQKNAFEPLVNSLVVNPSAATAFAPQVRTSEPKAALDYLIITSAALSNAFQQVAGMLAGILATLQFQRQHDVFQGIEAVEQLE